MKRGFKILGVILCIFLVLGVFMFIKIKNAPIPQININDVSIKDINDGMYTGEYKVNPVQAKVEVEVEGGIIKNIAIKEHMNGLGKKGEKVVDSIVKSQSLQVDAISGATLSSNVIRKAVEEALTK